MKLCTCCRRAISPAEWNRLRLRGHQVDDVETLELRDCVCGSTLCIVLPAPETVRPSAEMTVAA